MNALLKRLHPCVHIWHEMLLQRPTSHTCAHLEEEFMWSIPRAECSREITETDIRALAALVGRWTTEWNGPTTLRRLETTGRRPTPQRLDVRRISKSTYTVGDLFCVRNGSILCFDSRVYMRLYVQLVDRELDPSIFGPLSAALSIEPTQRHTEARLVSFDNQRVDQLRSPMLWRNLAELMWPGVEAVSATNWRAELNQFLQPRSGMRAILPSIEAVAHSVVELDGRATEPIIIVERDAQGRHARCLLVKIRASQWQENTGSILFVSYVGVEARMGPTYSMLFPLQ